ncbi:MAG TPA: PorV/PorQ family protein [Candidatus Saccharimonadales bacterium]|nr:PorV/PorQ family protein [Candidatus Saccharimonadales bacterium]
MRFWKCGGVVLLGVALAAAPAAADKYSGEFLKLGVGARALGMGGAFVSLSDDATALYWNPAGLAFLHHHMLMPAHSEEFGQILNYDYLAYVQPLGPRESLGIGIVRLSLDNIPLTDSLRLDNLGQPIYDEGRLIYTSDTELALLMSYGRAVSSRLNLGATAKLIRQSVADHSSFGIGADVGAIYSPSPSVSIGLAVDDVFGTFLSWDTGHHERISPSARLGGSLTRALGRDHLVTLAGDLYFTFDGRRTVSQFSSGQVGGEYHLGVEYWFKRALALRTGYNHGSFTAGAGGRRGRFALDYAFISNSNVGLDNTQRISGSFEF